MNDIELSQELIDFIEGSPSMFHTVATAKKMLVEAGVKELHEGENWKLQLGERYFTTRNNSSVIAFSVGKNLPQNYHFQLTAAHSDSPTFKIKQNPVSKGVRGYSKLNVEGYGGMIDSTWLDRPLGIAGRLLIEEDSAIVSKLVFINEDLVLIPNVAIHLNRDANNGYAFNKQIDMQALLSADTQDDNEFMQYVAQYAGVSKEQILGFDLYLQNRERPCIWGMKKEFVSTPKLDDLQCAFTSLKAFIASHNDETISVCAIFDNEEVGSNTKQGAMSTFLKDTLERINASLGKSVEDLMRAYADSFLVSCDNAHAIHPNRPELYDADNASVLNGGIVIKEAANQTYTTDAFSRAIFTSICKQANVPCQLFANRSDRRGGSTLGNLSNIQVSMHAVDMGLPQLAMHSSYETAGVKDTAYAVTALTHFFNTTIMIEGSNKVSFK